jgi:DNA-binding transcriptional regulator YhcF (GntR family)
MGQSITQIEAAQIHPDAYPVTRVATEFHLRSFDLLTQLEGEITDALIVSTLIHDQLRMPRRTGSGSIRELSRKLEIPAETVRRHVQALMKSGRCASNKGIVTVPATALRGRRISTFLRKVYVNTVRLLADLTRIDVATFASASRRPVRAGRLEKEQLAIAVAGTGLLLAGFRALRAFWGDLMKGLVYTAIWTANVKHVTNTDPVANRWIVDDSERLPVSVLTLSRSLRLPYETVRRHADDLVRDGICVRAGRRGLFVPNSFIRRIPAGPVLIHRLVMDFLAELRRAGVRV